MIFERLETRTLLDGELDTAWGTGGVMIGIDSGFLGFSEVHSVEVEPAGNPVASGPGRAVRYGAAGNVESSVALDLTLLAPLALADGRYAAITDHGLFLYAADGTQLTQFTGGNLSAVPSGMESRYRDFVLAPNGDILLAGQVGTSLFGAEEAEVHWGGVEVWSPDGQRKAAIEIGWDIQVAAFVDGTLFIATGGQLWRYSPSGALDTRFGDGGKINIASDPAAQHDLAIDQYGRVYLSHSKAGATSRVMRYRFNGSRDTTFGANGTVDTAILALNGAAATLGNERVFVAPDGQMYVAAMVDAGADDHLAVGRITAAGAKDSTWGTGGIAIADVTDGDRQGGQARDLALMPDGDVLVAAVGGNGQSAIARFQGTRTGTPSPVNLVDGKLTVAGTSGNDTILFQSTADFGINVTVNGALHGFGELEVGSILVLAGDGDDYVEARDLSPLPDNASVDFEMAIDGGGGNDVLVGHQGRDRIRGESGDDKVHGWSGDDWLSGNAQKDRVYGSAGNDLLSGNGGRDRLVGEEGNDTLTGGDQPDLLIGLAGDDSLMGEGGHDRLDGGAGADFLYGAGGDDTFWARDGEIDELIGGIAGLDTAQVDEDDVVVAVEQLLA